MDLFIQSASNPIYKHVKKLLNKQGRAKYLQYLTEGSRSVIDAIEHGCDIEFVVLAENAQYDLSQYNIKTYRFADKLYDDVKSTVNSQGITAVVNFKMNTVRSPEFKSKKKIVYLDCISDPGNMGTILRSADAFGMDAVVVSKGCVDIFSPKVVRSSMASMMNIDIFFDDTDAKILGDLASDGFCVMGTFPRGDVYSYNADFKENTVIVMGNEANGIRPSTEKYCNVQVTIPMKGAAESLNVASAATVMMYELSRHF